MKKRTDPASRRGLFVYEHLARDKAGERLGVSGFLEYEREQARKRMQTAGAIGGMSKGCENLPTPSKARAADKAGERLGVSGFLEYEREQARKRMAAGGNGGLSKGVENLPPLDSAKARDKAGERLGVSGFLEYEREQARKRQGANSAANRRGDTVQEKLPEQSTTAQARDKAGERLGVSGFLEYEREQVRKRLAIKRRREIWTALHPNSGTSGSTIQRGRGQPEQFAADTAKVSGQSKQDINRHLARAEACHPKQSPCPGDCASPLPFFKELRYILEIAETRFTGGPSLTRRMSAVRSRQHPPAVLLKRCSGETHRWLKPSVL